MYALTKEQLLSIPFDERDQNVVVQKLIRLSVDSKRRAYPELWGESTDERPVVNLKEKFDGVITGGELSFFTRDKFVTVKYARLHSVDIGRYKTNAGDGKYVIDGVWIGNSPYPEHRDWVPGWAFSYDYRFTDIYVYWNSLEMGRLLR